MTLENLKARSDSKDLHALTPTSDSFYQSYRDLLQHFKQDDIFLRVNNMLGCPHREIDSIRIDDKRENLFVELFVNFLGLQGASSQLPSYMLDKLARNNDGSDGWSLLFDFFNHYILRIFFDIVALKSYPRSFEGDFEDKISQILFHILGLRDKQVARTYLPFSPIILSLRKPKNYIEKVLEINFNLKNKISIIENVAHHIPIHPQQQNRLGYSNNILGNGFIIGKSVISYQTKIAILIKDISYQEALKFFPTSQRFMDLREAVLFLTNYEFALDLHLLINHSDIMSIKLGANALNNTAKIGLGGILGKQRQSVYFIKIKMWG
ncbi:type VI secretion system baseplate subunit TssG [Helicobacter didelphidarum]|uniref:Type VI secretion system baseplate subunit TssG n=1 Tax=Helicobacter didelphidarum TaxID=2040648 RepID=A0A3D8IDB8_9HELI|nr:type VI secretion system baseplate subunit TssG [Helicobacter didelphidarum]RDU62936.1 type VI secretion system baseplate subunit TssG [Helicobacter didelphidarum]